MDAITSLSAGAQRLNNWNELFLLLLTPHAYLISGMQAVTVIPTSSSEKFNSTLAVYVDAVITALA